MNNGPVERGAFYCKPQFVSPSPSRLQLGTREVLRMRQSSALPNLFAWLYVPPILFTRQPDGRNEARAQVNDLARCSIWLGPRTGYAKGYIR